MDARVSTLPSVHGEKVVIRLLSRADTIPDLATVGLEQRDFDTLVAAISAPQGLVLITGPTGSGKTNTLYAAIGQILSPGEQHRHPRGPGRDPGRGHHPGAGPRAHRA